MPRDALANLRKLPEWCYGIIDGKTVIITRGARSPITPRPMDKASVDIQNRLGGVTRAQRAAMEMGATIGWDCLGADPDEHGVVHPRQKYTICTPMVKTVEVYAYNESEAFYLAEKQEGETTQDGTPVIVEILNDET